ncbi:MAG: hypothetical protein Fur0025_25350 [Oscillatoriaceae cyanobacterium]
MSAAAHNLKKCYNTALPLGKRLKKYFFPQGDRGHPENLFKSLYNHADMINLIQMNYINKMTAKSQKYILFI